MDSTARCLILLRDFWLYDAHYKYIVGPLCHNFLPINRLAQLLRPTRATRSFPVSKIDLNGLFAPQMVVLVLPECT